MAELDYSDEAKNIINKFYQVDTIVYVEGIDDVPFWEFLFKKFSPLTFEIKEVGGYSEIKKHIEKISNGEVFAVVACDADFSYVGNFPLHPNIIRSYGYSIENSMICEKSIKKILKSIGRLSNEVINTIDIENWIDELNLSSYDLILHDIANHLLHTGKVVTGSNCSRFLASKNSYILCHKKIRNHLNTMNIPIDNNLETNILKSLEGNNRDIFNQLRGHFFFSIVLKFISVTFSKVGKNISLSKDALFGALLLAFESVFNDDHLHYQHYSNFVCNIKKNA